MRSNYLKRDFSKIRTIDKQSSTSRSAQMSKIKSTRTKFENDFIAQFKKEIKVKYRLNASDVRGKPDILIPKYKICIFLDSDFWHGWQYPRWSHQLKNDFWRNKIEKNRKRDKITTRYLRANGWSVIRLWEHKIRVDCKREINKIRVCIDNLS